MLIPITYRWANISKGCYFCVAWWRHDMATHSQLLSTLKRNPPHDDVIKWKHFPRNWPFVRGIHRSTVNSPYKGQWRGALMFSLICARINGWVNNGEAGDLRRYRAHFDVIVMVYRSAERFFVVRRDEFLNKQPIDWDAWDFTMMEPNPQITTEAKNSQNLDLFNMV